MNSPKIKHIEVLEEKYLKVLFSNGTTKKFNINIVSSRPNYETLQNPSFLRNFKLDPTGYSVYWNDQIDICENELWEKGELIT